MENFSLLKQELVSGLRIISRLKYKGVNNMRVAKSLIVLGSLGMIIALVNVFLNGNLSIDGPKLLNNAWGIISLVDLYLGLLLFTIWMIFREKNIIYIVLMLILTTFFGFLAVSIYVLINIQRSKGDWKEFFLGARKDIFTGDNQWRR